MLDAMKQQEPRVTSNYVREHYSNLLAEHYDWMFGMPFETKVAEQKHFLESLVGLGEPGSLAIDLGCGSGFQSLALADLGYRVLAIDTNEWLLRTLKERSASHPINATCGDILEIETLAGPASADVVVCMGDTITHLPSLGAVSELVGAVARILRPRGQFVVTYRDLAAVELEGLDRFIPVRSDDQRIMTCFLECTSAETVVVNDLIHVRDDRGWTLHKSRYQKLRLPAEWLLGQMKASALSATRQPHAAMIAISAMKLRT